MKEKKQKNKISTAGVIFMAIMLILLSFSLVFQYNEKEYYKEQMLSFCDISNLQIKLIDATTTPEFKEQANAAGLEFPKEVDCNRFILGGKK
jgi:hypothetical protein